MGATTISSADSFRVWADSPFFQADFGLVLDSPELMPALGEPMVSGRPFRENFAGGLEPQAPLPVSRRVVGVSRKSIFDHYLDGAMSTLQRSYQQDQGASSKNLILRWQTHDLVTRTSSWADFCWWFLRRQVSTSHSRKGLFPPRHRFDPCENGLVVWVGPEVLLPTPGGRAIRSTVVNGDFHLAVPFEMVHIYRECLPEYEHRIVPTANRLAEFSLCTSLLTGRLTPISRGQTLRVTRMAGHWGGWLRYVFLRYVERLLPTLPRGLSKSLVLRPLFWLAHRASLLNKRNRAGRVWDTALKIEESA